MTKLRRLNRTMAHRLSMLTTQVSQLVKIERIETTVAKTKEVRRQADRMVQLGKDRSLSAAFARGDAVIHKLFTELAYRYKDRVGGYTRLLRTRRRVGDAAPMAYIEFVDRDNELKLTIKTTGPSTTTTKSSLGSLGKIQSLRAVCTS